MAMFLESDGDGERLAAALAVCAERRIGVAVLKVGASQAGGRAAAAHTGSLAGDQRVFRALIEEAGGAWARDPHELLELARAMAEPRARPARQEGLAVLTCSGGDSALAADEAEKMEVPLPDLGAATRGRLQALLPDAATIGNPLDYTAMIWGESELLSQIVRTVGEDEAIGQLLLLYDHPRDLSPESEADWAAVREGLLDGAGECAAAALVASTLPDLVDEEANLEFAARGVPAVGGLTTALACARALRSERAEPDRLRAIAASAARAGRRAAGRPAGPEPDAHPRWLSEGLAKEALRAAGIAVPRGGEADSGDECVAIADEDRLARRPKLSAPHVRHKSDTGGLVLGIDDETRAARGAGAPLGRSPTADGARCWSRGWSRPGSS